MVNRLEQFVKDEFDQEMSPIMRAKIQEFVDYDPYIHLEGDRLRSIVTSRVVIQAFIKQAMNDEVKE